MKGKNYVENSLQAGREQCIMSETIISRDEFNIIYQQNRDYLFEKNGYLPVLLDTVWVNSQSGKRVLFHKGKKFIEK